MGTLLGVGSQREWCDIDCFMDCDYFTHEVGAIAQSARRYGSDCFFKYCYRMVVERDQYVGDWFAFVRIYRNNHLLVDFVYSLTVDYYGVG